MDIVNAEMQLYLNGKETTLTNIVDILKQDEFYNDISNDGDKIEIKKDTLTAKVDKDLQVSVRNENQPDLMIGDYVAYIPTPTQNYEVKSELTGYETSQFFSTDETAQWRVLSIEGDMVKLISSSTLHEESLSMNGAIGYNNSVETLNAICTNLYSNPTKNIYASSVTGADIEKLLGISNWNDEWKVQKEYYGEIYNVSDYGTNNKVPDIITGESNELGYSRPINLELKNDYKYFRYENTPKFVGDKDNPIFQLLVIKGNYWLATRYIESFEEYAGFNVGIASGVANSANILFTTSDEITSTNYSSGIRPVIKVPFSVIIKNETEDGSIEHPYSLNI